MCSLFPKETIQIFISLCFRYVYNDPELVKVLDHDNEFLDILSGGRLPEDVVPALQYVWESKNMRRLKEGINDVLDNFLRKKYNEHVESFNKGIQ